MAALASRAMQWARQQLAAAALRALLEETEAMGLAVLPVKGFVSARTLYAHPSERPMADVDVRARPEDAAAIEAIARRRGWSLEHSNAQLGTFGLFIDGVSIEVETTIGPPFVARIEVDDLLARATWAVDALGFRYRVPEAHDHAIVMCLNAFKDHLRPPTWAIEDLLRIAQMPNFRASTLVARAREARIASAVANVARWLARDARGAVWAAIAARFDRSRGPYDWLYAHTADARPVVRMIVTHAGGDGVDAKIFGVCAATLGAIRWKVRSLRGALGDLPHASS